MNGVCKDISRIDRSVGALIGLACGDAVGTTLEFKTRGTFEPITDMVGRGPFSLPAGAWTDDMSMALCLGHSLVACKGFDPADQMERYCNWYETGYMSSTGRCFDIGNTVLAALKSYKQSGHPYSGSTDERSSGNGSLMRISPVAIVYQSDPEACLRYARLSSMTTHASVECIESCVLFVNMLVLALEGKEKSEIIRGITYKPTSPSLACILDGSFTDQHYDDLTGSGYVIESLISALWCFMHSETFEDAILQAANLGNDADTTAAICGQIAGAYYGAQSIPRDWINKLVQSEEIEALAHDLFATGNAAVQSVV